MGKPKKTSPSTGKILYGMGGLSAVTGVVFLLLFLPEFEHIHEVSLLVAGALGILLPVFLMPLCYAFINGNTAIGTGRYHLPMLISHLVATVAFVLLLGIGKIHPAAQAFALFGLLFLYSLAMQIFSYTYFSVGQRFDPSGRAIRLRNIFFMVSIALAAVMVLWLGRSDRDSVRDIIALAAIVSMLSLVCVYAATVQSMPNFIRLEPYHKRSVKESYKRFVSPLKNRVVFLFSIATFMVCIGVGIVTSAIPQYVFSYVFGLNKGYKPAILVFAAVLAFSGFSVTRLLRQKGEKVGTTLVVTLSSVQVALAVAVVVFLSVPIAKVWKAIILFTFASLGGVTLGSVFAVEERCKEYAVRLSDCTPGKYSCLRNAVATAGLAVGIACTCVIRILAAHLGSIVGAVVSCALYSAIVLGSVLICRMGFADKLWRAFSHKEEAQEEDADVHD